MLVVRASHKYIHNIQNSIKAYTISVERERQAHRRSRILLHSCHQISFTQYWIGVICKIFSGLLLCCYYWCCWVYDDIFHFSHVRVLCTQRWMVSHVSLARTKKANTQKKKKNNSHWIIANWKLYHIVIALIAVDIGIYLQLDFSKLHCNAMVSNTQ